MSALTRAHLDSHSNDPQAEVRRRIGSLQITVTTTGRGFLRAAKFVDKPLPWVVQNQPFFVFRGRTKTAGA